MNFSQSYQFLLSLQNQRGITDEPESATARFARLGHFLAACDNPHLKIAHYIHVTGTSGKGSTATMIAAMCTAAGLKTGLLTSPHISQITERWRINGTPMSRRDFCTLIEQLKTTYDRFLANYPLKWVTYHEVLTLIGFIYFAQKNVDYAVLEVGMGGDLDATNIIPHKDAAVITTVGADHLELLGPTLADVAHHKAGIITMPTAVITGVSDAEHRAIITERVQATGSICPDIPLNYTVLKKTAETTVFVYQNTTYSLHAFGEHQIKNAILAIRTAECLALPLRAIKRGLRLARFPLRFECLKRAPWCIADGAHNPEKFAARSVCLTC
jgi:dihydrofolate synthase/folylpolyglutamate synthase